MSTNDVADIQATLKNIGVQVTPEQIKNKLQTLAKYRVTGDEAKRQATRSLAKAAGVDPAAIYKTSTLVKVADVKEDGKWVNLEVKVVHLWDNTSEKVSQTGLIGDETGVIKFTAWATTDLPELEEGKCYEINNAVTNLYNERFQINLNKNTSITPLTEDIEVQQQEEEFAGAIVSIQRGSGLIKRCPECNRALVKGACGEHGKVEGIYDLRIKAVLDNGAEIRELILNADQTFAVTGIDLNKAKEIATAALDTSAVTHEIENLMLGKYHTAKGNSTGRYLLVKSMSPLTAPVNIADIAAAVEAI